MEQSIDVSAYLAALRRRWWLMLLPIAILTPVAVAVAYVLPPVYVATARILVESQQIPSELAQSTVRVGVAERVALINQRLMTRQNLLEVAQRLNITAGLGPMSPTQIVEMMRANTTIAGVRLSGPRGPVTGVNVSFQANRGPLAAQVANEFVSLLVEQNIQQRTGRAFETSAYFREETRRLSEALMAVERQIAEFKLANATALPESLEFRRRELATLQERIFERELRQIELVEQRKRIEEALTAGDFAVFDREPTAEEVEVQRLQRTLLERRSVYSDDHPLVRSLQARLSVLETRVASADGAAGTASDAESRGGPAEQFRQAIAAIDEQIDRMETRLANEIARIAELEQSIEATPNVELALASMQRDLSALQTQHRQATVRLADAETGERLEVNQQAERMEVIEQAEVPSSPASPKRKLIVAAGFVGASGVGVALVVLAELLNRSVRSAADLERALNLRPVVTIPYIRTRNELVFRRWAARLGLALTCLLAVAFLFAVDNYFMPMPLLAERIMSITGLDALSRMIDMRLSR